MESKLIGKINQNYIRILNLLKSFLKENFNEAKKNSEIFNSFEDKIKKFNKTEEIEKYIKQFSNENDNLIDKFKNIKKNINELITDILENKIKIIENVNESLYLIKHPKDCLYLLKIEDNNNYIYNYINLIDYQINSHKYDKLEQIYFVLCNTKIGEI